MPDDKPKDDNQPKPDAPKADAPASDAAPVPDAPSLEPEPLSDGTVPTVLAKGDSTKPAVPSAGDKRSLGSVYRRADIVTTLITFGATVAVAALVFGGYLYLTRSKAKTAAPKVTSLDSADLSKLGAFFQGDAAGSGAQILTFNSASLFKGRVALNSDLKVAGAAEVDGATELGDLTVNKTSTLGVTSIRGQLTVSGPLSLQSPATLSGGATVTGNLAVSGNGSFGGSLSAGLISTPNLIVNGNLNIAGHIIINGSSPTVTPNEGAGAGATATISGTDTAGVVTINTGNIAASNNSSGAELVQINFHTTFGGVPVVLVTAVGQSAGTLQPYVVKTAGNFIIGTSTNDNVNNPTPILQSHTSYSFDYWAVQ